MVDGLWFSWFIVDGLWKTTLRLEALQSLKTDNYSTTLLFNYFTNNYNLTTEY